MDAYTGQIILFAGDYEPQDWAFCDGRQVKINDYQALYALIGTVYGGDGRVYFNLPDLRGRVALGQGQGVARAPAPQLTARTIGQAFGAETVVLQLAEIPAHRHALQASTAAAVLTTPGGSVLATPQNAEVMYFTPPASSTPTVSTFASDTVISAGGNQAHDNHMATQALSYLICLNGLFPDRP